MIFLNTFRQFFPMSCHTLCWAVCHFNFLYVTLNSAQKTASSLSVKTILGKTFAGSTGTVNACTVLADYQRVFLRIRI